MSTKNIICPTCGKSNTWQKENYFRPFCSERCRLIDLGEWANESYKIPIETPIDDLSNEDEDIK